MSAVDDRRCAYCQDDAVEELRIYNRAAVTKPPTCVAVCAFHGDLWREHVNGAETHKITTRPLPGEEGEDDMTIATTDAMPYYGPQVVADEVTRAWREKQFKLLGFGDAYALSLDAEVDLGMARNLIEGGCKPEIATRIL